MKKLMKAEGLGVPYSDPYKMRVIEDEDVLSEVTSNDKGAMPQILDGRKYGPLVPLTTEDERKVATLMMLRGNNDFIEKRRNFGEVYCQAVKVWIAPVKGIGEVSCGEIWIAKEEKQHD